jgi:hypothetical protein
MRKGLRIFAALMNFGLLVFFSYHLLKESPPDLWVAVVILATLGINLLALAQPSLTESDSWLELWLKRKRLEERKRIKDLESS